MNCDDLEPWKEVILKILESHPDLFLAVNNEGGSPKTIDAQRGLGVMKLIEEKEAKDTPKEVKPAQPKPVLDALDPPLKKNSKSESEELFLEENKSPFKSGDKKGKNKDSRKKKKENSNSKDSSGGKQKEQTPSQPAKKTQVKNQKESKKENKDKKQRNKKDKNNFQKHNSVQAEMNYKEKLKSTIESSQKTSGPREKLSKVRYNVIFIG